MLPSLHSCTPVSVSLPPVSISLSVRACFGLPSLTIFDSLQSDCLMVVYGVKDNETVDKDTETHAKVIETGGTKLMRLEYTTDLCQS